MHLRRMTRSPVAYWSAVAVLAAVTGLFVARLVDEAQAQRARYGAARRVAVVTRPLDVGHRLIAADVAVHVVPRAFVPVGAFDAPDAVVGRTVVVRLFPGEAVLESHLAPAGLRGLAAHLAPGRRAVAVPAGAATPVVRVGDQVDVLATLEGHETVAIAEAATVIDAAENAVTVAVDTDEASRVADAASRGALTLAVRSPVEVRSA